MSEQTIFPIGSFVKSAVTGDVFKVEGFAGDRLQAVGPTGDKLLWPAKDFTSAPVEKIIWWLLENKQWPVRMVFGHGKAEDEFGISLLSPAQPAYAAHLESLGLTVLETTDTGFIVHVPAQWMYATNSTPIGRAATSTEATLTADYVSETVKQPLSELELAQQKIARLEAQLAAKESTLIDLRTRFDEMVVAAENDPVITPSATAPHIEIAIVNNVEEAELSWRLSEGWEARYMQFVETRLHVVFIRDARPQPTTGERPAAAARPTTVHPSRIINAPAEDRPLVSLVDELRQYGLAATEARMNADLVAAGRAAYESKLPPAPPPFTRIPGRIS